MGWDAITRRVSTTIIIVGGGVVAIAIGSIGTMRTLWVSISTTTTTIMITTTAIPIMVGRVTGSIMTIVVGTMVSIRSTHTASFGTSSISIRTRTPTPLALLVVVVRRIIPKLMFVPTWTPGGPTIVSSPFFSSRRTVITGSSSSPVRRILIPSLSPFRPFPSFRHPTTAVSSMPTGSSRLVSRPGPGTTSGPHSRATSRWTSGRTWAAGGTDMGSRSTGTV